MIDLTAQGLRFRPIENADESLLETIYASTRAREMAMLPEWTEDQKRAFVRQQFQAQHTYYQQMFPQALYLVILADEQPIGRLYLDYREKELRITDITLLPDFRGRGLGEQILRSLIEEAREMDQTVTIHVERVNPALHLYERLGFRVVNEENQVYLLMEWRPESAGI